MKRVTKNSIDYDIYKSITSYSYVIDNVYS